MKSTVRHRLAALSVLSLLLGLACSSQSHHGVAETSAAARDSLRAVLRATVRQDTPRELRDSVPIHVGGEESSAVTGLSYHWAIVSLGPHIGRQRVGGVYRREYRLLQSEGDWAALVSEWTPATTDEALQACVEVLEFASPWGLRYGGKPLVYHDTSQFVTSLLLPPRSAADSARLRPPQVQSAQGHWTARVWIATPGEMYDVSCTFPAGGGLVVVAHDSIQGAGFLF